MFSRVCARECAIAQSVIMGSTEGLAFLSSGRGWYACMYKTEHHVLLFGRSVYEPAWERETRLCNGFKLDGTVVYLQPLIQRGNLHTEWIPTLSQKQSNRFVYAPLMSRLWLVFYHLKVGTQKIVPGFDPTPAFDLDCAAK
jgi:hypothetical protein